MDKKPWMEEVHGNECGIRHWDPCWIHSDHEVYKSSCRPFCLTELGYKEELEAKKAMKIKEAERIEKEVKALIS